MACHVRWCKARYFMVNLIMSTSFTGMSWRYNKHIRYMVQIFWFFLFERKLFSFDLLSNISLLFVLICYMNVIYKKLDTFSFTYMSWRIWSLVSTSSITLLQHCWDVLSRSGNATVWTILAYIGLYWYRWRATQY